MVERDVVVVGVGMMTAVGLSAGETAASVRAATMRFSESDWLDQHGEAYTMAEVIDEGLPELAGTWDDDPGVSRWERRLLRLGTMPLLESLKPLGQSVGLILALPETERREPLDRAAFLKHFALQTEGAFEPGCSDAAPKGRAGGLIAVGQASERIRAGRARFVLAAGIDTYRNRTLLGTFDRDKRLKTSYNLDGFIPGEGAGSLLLACREAAEAAGLPPLAAISIMTQGFEEGHLDSEKPYLGEGLARAVAKFHEGSGIVGPIHEVYSSMNGENYWAKEWGVAYLRNRTAFSPSLRIHHPADCYGDVGSACGPLLVGLAVLGLQQGYRRSPCLIYCSSDQGQRAVLAVSSP